MERGGGVHTVPSAAGAGWWNKVNGKVVSKHRTKDNAVIAEREIARRMALEHTIHPTDGTISEKNSYGNDPFPPKDSE